MTVLAGQSQTPPQPSSWQSRPVQFGTHSHFPFAQRSFGRHGPQAESKQTPDLHVMLALQPHFAPQPSSASQVTPHFGLHDDVCAGALPSPALASTGLALGATEAIEAA
jgi:hypothetical protein